MADPNPPVIVWFRQDLRLADNPALQAAAATGAPVIPVYILDDDAYESAHHRPIYIMYMLSYTIYIYIYT